MQVMKVRCGCNVRYNEATMRLRWVAAMWATMITGDDVSGDGDNDDGNRDRLR